MPSAVEVAPQVLHLLGHDVRWQLIRTLAKGDYRVNELVDAIGLPQSLVSYHLRLLRDSELVGERRSSADARDVYYHLDLDRLGDQLNHSAAMVHPAISQWAPSPLFKPRRRPTHVLFICTGNSARSQIAEAIMRSEFGNAVRVHSAGPSPTGVHPLALQVLDEMDIEVTGLRSKGMEDVRGIDFDFVVTLCDKAKEVCPPEGPDARYIHWSLADPAQVQGSLVQRRKAFQATAAEIAVRVRHLIPLLERRMEV